MRIAFFWALALAMTSCGSDNANRADESGAGTETPSGTTGGETPASNPTPVDEPPVTGIEVEEVAPAKPDEIQVLETKTQAKISRMNFIASDATEEQRYLSEYLLVIRALDDTCARLKVRPSTGITSTIKPEVIFGDGSQETELEAFSCAKDTAEKVKVSEEQAEAEQKGTDEAQADATDPASSSTETPAAQLNLIAELAQKRLEHLDFIRPQSRSFLTAPATAALCSQRIFRMQLPSANDPRIGQGRTLESVATKTGYLVAASANVRVWVDSEVGNPCFSGSPGYLATEKLVLGSLVPSSYSNTFDRFGLDHFTNLANEAEKIYSTLTTAYGPTSDVDGNTKIELFVSPDVNRFRFYDQRIAGHDQFVSNIIYKPQDLAVYDSTLNPAGNESEVVYVWAPDPGGIFQYSLYPTANSLTSNYVKGYIGQQIMTNIMLNAHLITRTGPAEEPWLITGLSLLASAYVAGNDYSFNFLAEYFGSRHQYLSLTNSFDDQTVPFHYREDIPEGRAGMQGLFGWYLHARKCGQSAALCTDLKKLIDTDLVGIANVENYLGVSFPDILDNFGTTIGVELSENQSAVRAVWAAKGTANPPQQLPVLQQVRTDDPPQTFEQNQTADPVTGSGDDRAIAGPILSRDALIYQPILPDQDLVVSLQKHSVAYFALSGLVTKETELSAYLGPNIKVTIVPLGERDSTIRKIHLEKRSEFGHMDQRPYNLTVDQDVNHTYYAAPEHPTSYTVDSKRELWVLGSVDNFTVNETGDGREVETEVGDVDAYTISVDACSAESDPAACRAAGGTKQVLVQVIPRDFAKELEPMLLVTNTSMEMFGGRVFMPQVTQIESDFIQNEDDPDQIGILCESQAFHQATPASPDVSTFGNCANGGLTPTLYQTEVCDAFPGVCTSTSQQSVSYDAYAYSYYQQNSGSTFTGPLFDNYLHAGPGRFPVWNNLTIDYFSEEVDRVGARPFLKEELVRQFYEFGYKEDTQASTYFFYPVLAGGYINPVEPDFDNALTALSETQVDTLLKLRQVIETQAVIADLATDCEALGIPENLCADPHGQWQALEQEILSRFGTHKILCQIADFSSTSTETALDSVCPGRTLTITGTVNGQPSQATVAWLSRNRFIIRAQNPISYNLTTFYQPVYPDVENGASDFCKGKPVANPHTTTSQLCPILPGNFKQGDVRYQLNVATQKFTTNCTNDTLGTDFLVCGDRYAFRLDLDPDDPLFETAIVDGFTTDRNRVWHLPLARRGGELIGKPHAMHFVRFEIPVAQEVKINVIVGGRQKTQGKYLMRVRLKDSITITP